MKTVLLVDDDKDLRECLSDALSELGWEVIPASNGAEAYELFQKFNEIDLVLTDIDMPIRNGLLLLADLRQAAPALTIIVMTGGSRFTEAQVLDLGASFFIEKPFCDIQTVLRTI